jgi:hypothetical protein
LLAEVFCRGVVKNKTNKQPKPTNTGHCMSAKLKVKLGHIEVECEGTEEFIKAELPALMKSFSELLEKVPVQLPPLPAAIETNGSARQANGKRIDLSLGTIATKLNCSTGPDLALAAAAFLTVVQAKDTFDRKEILACMQGASNHYKESYSSNMTKILASVVGDNKLIERASGVYALAASTRNQMEASLGQE